MGGQKKICNVGSNLKHCWK